MRTYDRYLVTLALLFTSTTVVLAAYNQHRIDLYFSLYLIEYLVVTLLFGYLRQGARRLLNVMGYILFAGFLGIVGMKVATILLGAGLF